MKKVLPLLLLATIFLSFSQKESVKQPLPFCSAFNKVMQDAQNNFSNLKGEYDDSFDDGTKQYKLKVLFDGWKNNYYMVETSAIYVEISTGLLKSKEAEKFFNTATDQVESCLGTKRKLVMKGDLKLYKFYRGKTEITLMFSQSDEEQPILLTFENI